MMPRGTNLESSSARETCVCESTNTARDAARLTPANEPQRLRVLRSYEVLDSEPEPEFDALTRIAAHAFAVPIAVVAMVDSDRLWFKSRIGLAVPQLDRRIALCAHTIMPPSKMLVVEDLRSDARFADNPLVTNVPHIRFYAGAAIVDHDDHALGTIAAIDTRPGTFSHAQRRALADLSSLAMMALQSRRRALDLRRLAMTDYLTGIANRVKFEASITRRFIPPGNRASPSTSSCWTSTDSRTSMTPLATRQATRCCASWPSG